MIKIYLPLLLIFLVSASDIKALKDSPKSISPGGIKSPGTELTLSDIKFKWGYKKKNTGFALFLSKMDAKGSFKVIYKIKKPLIKKTYFVLPKKYFSRGGVYRWNVKAKTGNRWSELSERLYFTIVDQLPLPVSKTRIETAAEETKIIKHPKETENEFYSEPEDIFILLKYNGIVNNMIPAVFYKKDLYIPFRELMENLKIPIKKEDNIYTSESGNIYNVLLDLNSNLFDVNGNALKLDSNSLIHRDGSVFIRKDLYEKNLNANLNFSFGDLSLNIYSSQYFPVYSSYVREQNYKLLKKNNSSKEFPLMFPSEFKLIDGGIFDYDVTSYFSKDLSPFYRYQFALGGILFGGETRFDMRGLYEKSLLSTDDYNYYWNYPINQKYLTRISAGNQYIQGINFYQGEGISISNEPLSQRYLFNEINYSGNTLPNSVIELYINEKLTDFKRTDNDGNYAFKLPIGYGTTLLKTITYGNNGEVTDTKRLAQVTNNFIPSGQLTYTAFAGKYGKTSNIMGLASVSYGLNEWLTSKTGFEFLENDYYKKGIFQQNIFARILSNYILNLQIVPDIQYSINTQTIFTDLSTIYFNYTSFENNAFYNQAKIKQDVNAGIFLPLQSQNLFKVYFPVNLSMDGRYMQFENIYRYDFNIEASGNIGNLHPFIGFKRNFLENVQSYTSYTGGVFYSFSQLFNIFKGNIITAKVDFNSVLGKFNFLYVTYATDIFKNARMQIALSDNFDGRGTEFQFQLQTDLPFTRSSTSISSNIFSEGLSGSITRSGKNINFYNRFNSGKGAASFIFFSDTNSNDIFDPGEENVKNVKISLNGSEISQFDSEGSLNIYELAPYDLYKVSIDESKVKNPLLKPTYKNFMFYAEPNISKQLLIPFYTSGEISGLVTTILENTVSGFAGIRIIIRSSEGEIYTTSTFSDGSYYYFGLRPGKYEIYPDPEQAGKFKKMIRPSRHQFSIKINESGDSINDLNFQFY